jgi:transcriptional regulator with XRE-family HTH domain
VARERLAKESGVAAETIKSFELRNADPRLSTLLAWRRALEKAGVFFIDVDPYGGDDMGPGVRLRSPKPERQLRLPLTRKPEKSEKKG